jgi:hypothetical protein
MGSTGHQLWWSRYARPRIWSTPRQCWRLWSRSIYTCIRMGTTKQWQFWQWFRRLPGLTRGVRDSRTRYDCPETLATRKQVQGFLIIKKHNEGEALFSFAPSDLSPFLIASTFCPVCFAVHATSLLLKLLQPRGSQQGFLSIKLFPLVWPSSE